MRRQVLCQNKRIGIRNYFNIFVTGGGIKIFQNLVEFIQHTTLNRNIFWPNQSFLVDNSV